MDKILAQLAAQIEQFGAAAWDQAPLVYQDIIRAGMIKWGTALVLAGALYLLAVFLIIKWRTKLAAYEARGGRACAKCGHWESADDIGGWLFAACGLLIIATLLTIFASEGLLTAWLAPRTYLIDYLR